MTPKESLSGSLIFHEVPTHTLPTELLHRLALEAKESHPLEGSFVNLDDKVILAVEAPDRAYLRAARQRRGIFSIVWMWQTGFGSIATLTAWVGKEHSFARFCADGHSLIWDHIQKGKTPIYLIVCHNGAVVLVTQGEQSYGAIGDFEKNRPGAPLVRDSRAAYWHLFELSNTWHSRITSSDRLQLGWAAALHDELYRLGHAFEKEDARFPARDIAFPNVVTLSTFRAVWKAFLEKTVATTEWMYTFTEAFIVNGNFFQLAIESAQAAETVPTYSFYNPLVQRLLLLAALRPEVTNYGLRIPYWPGFVPGITFEHVGYKELPSARLEPGVEWYWRRACPDVLNLISEAVPFIDAAARPVDPKKNQQALARVKVSDSDACRASANALLNEAESLQQWTVPPGAIVELPFGPYARWQVWQFGDEFAFVAWTAEGEYAIGGLNLVARSLRVPNPAFERVEPLDEIEAALYLMMAAIVRDFLVVEERETAWLTREKSRIPGLRLPRNGRLITYIARRRYRPELAGAPATNALEEALHLKYRARHSVRAHLRKIDGEASPMAAILAQRYGLTIHTGYTFVKPYERGGREDRDVVYRSRSALAVLFGGEELEYAGKVVQWFKFERDVRALMKARGLLVEHVGADRNGDGGVDVYAWEPKNGATYAVQAKCWKRAVGPEVVRELVGALWRYPEGTKGMIVTTSRFTSGAVDEAAHHQIELIDGVAFLAEVHRAGIVHT